MLNSLAVLGSETALALYPILIKTVNTNLATQLVSRLVTYSALAFLFASGSEIQKTWGSLKGIAKSTGLGSITLIHILTSYVAFSELPAGISMSLFYTYPIFNIIISSLFFGESFGVKEILLVLVAFIGTILVSTSSKEEGFEGKGKEKEQSKLNWKGILAGLTAAFTESLMYFAVKVVNQGEVVKSPFYSVLELYPAALPLLLLGIFLIKEPIDTKISSWIPMTLFNSVVGFAGYALRFWAIPRLSTFVFSILSFVGVLASFLWGFLFVKEVPNWMSMLGATLITLSAGFSDTL
jgi:drug/metabolite transporter (DMT)-like permease